MKKYRLRKWVEYVLVVIAFLSFCVMGSECEDIVIFIGSKIIATGIFILSVNLLTRYSK